MNLIIQRESQSFGPFTMLQAGQLLREGRLLPQDLVRVSGAPAADAETLEDFMARHQPGGAGSVDLEALAGAVGTLRRLGLRLLFPWAEIQSAAWLKDRRLIHLAVAGMSPAVLLAVTRMESVGYWLIALYFSVLWAFFYFHIFRTPQVRVPWTLLAFVVTPALAIGSLMVLKDFVWWERVSAWPRSPDLATRLVAYIGVVGVHEELIKAAVLFWLVRRPGSALHPQTAVFYGMISGLGFGIYEGVLYQRGLNSQLEVTEAYFLNIARLTSLPFFHSVWSGIAGYFIGFAALYPRQRHGLWLLAIAIPAVAHGFYNTFTWGWLGLGSVFLCVLLLTLYLKNCGSVQRQLAGR